MRTFGAQEVDEIVRAFFRFSGPDPSVLCPDCGEDLNIEIQYAGAEPPGLRIRCRDCRAEGSWRQGRPVEPWKRLHLAYFRECRAKDRPPRCPIDDSRVVCTEFGDDLLEFRCPYCNRVGRVQTEIGNSRPKRA